MPTNFQPRDSHTLTPYITVPSGAGARALAFYAKALGAAETMRFEHQGSIAHAEFRIGDSAMMLGEEMPELGYLSPTAIGGTAGGFAIYVPDADAVVAQAVAAGAELKQPVQDQFYGDRSGSVRDPFGYHWTIATHKEDVSEEEMQRRFREYVASAAASAA